MVGLQTLDLAIGVRVPASQPNKSNSYGRLYWAARFANTAGSIATMKTFLKYFCLAVAFSCCSLFSAS